jgi:hydroxymethylbilane synthase
VTLVRLGTRGSRLALAQAHAVRDRLTKSAPALRVEIVVIQTSGDRLHDVALGPALGQAFFTKELEDALVDDRVDIAVHSCKDLGTVLADGLCLAAVPEREDTRDAVVAPRGQTPALPFGGRVGTSSPRRKRFLAAKRPDLEIVDMRGNVPTRIEAVDQKRVSAAVLAVAGLRRIGLADRISETLEHDVMLPAAGQGALAIEARVDDMRVRRLLTALDDDVARSEVTAERACLRRLGAGCQAPVGALARARGDALQLRAAVGIGGRIQSVELSRGIGEAEALGACAAEALLERLSLVSLRDIDWTVDEPTRSLR